MAIINWKDKEQVKAWHAEWRSKRRDVCCAHQKKWRAQNVEKTITNSARKRAKNKNLPFTISYKDVVIPEVCPVLKIPLEINQKGDGSTSKNSPTLDRIIPEKGYVQGNIQVISYLANTMKNCATEEELLMFSNWVQKTYGR